MSQIISVSLAWSGGKDSAYALHLLKMTPGYQVVRLHTTFGEETRRVGLHGIHESLIQKQASLIGLPLDSIYYPASGDNQAYEHAMSNYFKKLNALGIAHIGFGDIYLEDLKQYREKQLEKAGMQPVFPLWGKNTLQTANEIIQSGFLTLICAADADKIGEGWVGKAFSKEFLDALRPDVDPCGENGEFHTFCIDGPIFSKKVPIELGETLKKGYSFQDSDGKLHEKQFWFKNIKLID
ncbi:MAG: Dph6-related ATP pyrophosphatase [Cecembia sp.]